MKRSHLAILILLLVVLGAAAWLLARRSATSWQSTTGPSPEKVVQLSINDVAQITIQQPKAEVNLTKKGDGWVVAEKNYPANFDLISALIRTAWTLKSVQEVKVGQSQLGRLTLLPPGQGTDSGTLVDFKDAGGKRLAAILLGKKYMRDSPSSSFGPARSYPVGRYVMPQDNSHRVLLVSEALQQVDNKPEQWLDRTFIKIEKPMSIAVAGPSPEMSWKLEHGIDSAAWKLGDAKSGEQLDAPKANQVASGLNSLSTFTDVMAPDTKPESIGLDKPTTVTVTTEDGFSYVLTFGKKTDESYPLELKVSANFASARSAGKDEKPEEKSKLDKEFQKKKETLEKKLAAEKKFENRIYLVPKFGVEMLEKNREDLLTKPSPAPGGSPVAPGSARPPLFSSPAPRR